MNVEWISIAKQILQQRYQIVLEIQRMTEELKLALESNDTASSDLILQMRSQEMEQYDIQNQQLERLFNEIGEESLYQLISCKTDFTLWGEDGESLKKLAMRTKYVLSKTIQLDEQISKRLVGKNSFYNQGK